MLCVLVFEPGIVILVYNTAGACAALVCGEIKLPVTILAVETHARWEIARGDGFQILDVERKLTVRTLNVISLGVNLCKTVGF